MFLLFNPLFHSNNGLQYCLFIGAFMAMTETGCPDARDIAAGEEYPLCAFYYGDNELTGFLPAEAFTYPAGTLADTEYTLLITVEFGTEEQ